MIDLFDKNILKRILKFLPGYIAVLGILKLVIYYKCFDIRIVEYLDFSEVLLSFTDSLILLIFIIIVPCLLFISFLGKTIGNVNSEIFENQLETSFWSRLKLDIKGNTFLVILNIILISIFLIWGHWQWEMIIYFVMFPGISILFFLVRELRITYWKQYSYTIPVTYINIFYLLYMVTSIMTFLTIEDAKEVKLKNVFLGTEIYLENEILKSDSITTYIGQTKGYIFLYNKKEKTNISIPREKVLKLILKRN
ncbi:MAG: hypothetical protein JZU53_05235 [Paludibacter sp.]|nr:hypothetical protein [Paludibacter sp.]